MANNSAIVNSQHFQQPNSAHHCKECGLFFDSGKSLEVHLQYHKENLLNKWATQAGQSGGGASSATQQHEETNNNNTNAKGERQQVKREFGQVSSHQANTIAAAADSSDATAKPGARGSPGSRATPETSGASFGHPPTPQSYHSAPSPYQSHAAADINPAAAFSPGYQGYQQQQPPPKADRLSPLAHFGAGTYAAQQQMYGGVEQQQYFNVEPQQLLGYPQDYPVHKIPGQQNQSAFRYHPYHHQQQHPATYDRSPQVSSSSPAYPPHQNPQPTPSPSPKQCDKCGCVCDSASQLVEHLHHAHPPTPAPSHLGQQQHSFQGVPGLLQFQFGGGVIKAELKDDDEPQTEILDLDSHKVHQVFQSPEEEEEDMKRNGGELSGNNPHSVSAMLGPWPGGPQLQKMYSPAGGQDLGRMFLGGPDHQQKQHTFQLHTGSDYVVTSGGGQDGGGSYRPFEHAPPPQQLTPPNGAPVISSTQLPGATAAAAPPSGKGANWKSNEARRPKTYNCSACNKWFTSSGHLKRHYNTTLHKNAVKSSGQPDPATLPISAHHHPGRDSQGRPTSDGGGGGRNHSPDSAGGDPEPRVPDDGGGGMSPAFERTAQQLMPPGLLLQQQPPSGPYDRQQPPGHGPPGHHMHGANLSAANLSAGSPPNGEAGPSVTHHDLSRGLLSISTPDTSQPATTPLSPMAATMGAATSQQLAAFSLLSQHHMMGTQQLSPAEHSTTTSSLQQQQLHLQHHQQHHHQQQQQQVFQQMSPPSMQQSYPNGSAPHVTQTTATNSQPGSTSLTITGDQYAELMQYGLVGQQQQQQYLGQSVHHQDVHHEPLPSFAQFQSHQRYGILLAPAGYAVPSNVGGAGPATDPQLYSPGGSPYSAASPYGGEGSPVHASTYRLQHLHHHHQQHLDDDYEITVLENAAVDLASYSPPHHNNNNNDGDEDDRRVDSAAVTAKPAAVTPPPAPLPTKHHYENGSPRITSTGGPPLDRVAPAGVHKCFDCDKIFNKACYLTQHNKTFHSGDKPFKCHRCGKRFPSDQSYQDHLAKHAGDKPFKCELCPKQFNHKTDLRRHMCLHTGQKPYACEHCGKGFIRKDHMLKHAETHSRKTHAKHAHPS